LVLAGFIDVADRHRVAGWAADSDDPDAIAEVTIFVGGRRHVSIPCNLPRKDLKESGKYGLGNHGFMYSFPAPLAEYKEHRLQVIFSATGESLVHGHKVVPATRNYLDLKPILVTAPSRSGTTAFMNLLSQSPEICVAPVHPFEVRMLTYYWTAYRTLVAKGDLDKSTNPKELIGSPHFVGSNPFSSAEYSQAFQSKSNFHEVFSGIVPDALCVAFRKIICAYYEELAKDQKKSSVRYFAEKKLNMSPSVRRFTETLFGSLKEVVLTRDPRDIFASRLAYFNLDADAAFSELSIDCHDLLQMKIASDNKNTLFLRYEDMIRDRSTVCKSLSKFLEVEVPPEVHSPEAATKFSKHATSASAASSIGRWKRDLPDERKRQCKNAWGSFLEVFSYSDDAE
jgi:hypothetical protein